ncbi:hypothetical protein FJZ53_02415 [Candidatus Woesearchaeota archaeon]|nr:hypothetical protein [Candidatus Woesearchaeota archaeon]
MICIRKLKRELYELGNRFLKHGGEEDFREYQKKRREFIKIDSEKRHYHIAEDLRLIAEDLKEKYPSIASDALKLVDVYSAKAKGEK